VVYSWQARVDKEMHGFVAVKLGTFGEIKDALEREEAFLTPAATSPQGVCGWSSVIVPAPAENGD
jgi:hypothetical protein